MAPLSADDVRHFEAARRAGRTDAPCVPAFDDLTRLAAHLCDAPFAAISFQESNGHSSLFLESLGYPEMLPNLVLCACVPLPAPNGNPLGCLCIFDRVLRSLTADQEMSLRILARQAAGQIEMAERLLDQERLIEKYAAAQETLQRSETRLQEAQQVANIGSWEYDPATGHHHWSAEMFRLLDFDPGDGEPDFETLNARYHPDDVPMHKEAMARAVQDGLPYETDIRIMSRDGVLRWGHVIGQASRDETGRVTRLYGTVMDITDHRQAGEENARMAAIIASSHEAIMGVTLDGTLVSWNAGAERLYGYKDSEVIGQHASVLAPPEQRGFVTSIIQALQRGETREEVEVRRRRRDGTWIDIVLTFSPIRNQVGEMVGVAAIGHDVTGQHQAEEAVRISEARLAEAQRIAHLGSWQVDIQTGEVDFSQEMYRLFDLDMEAGMPPLEELLARYHPDDVEEHKATVARSQAEGKPFVTDTRIVRPNGEIRWCHSLGEPIFSETGTLLRLVGTTMDITDRMRVEERFRVLFEHSSEAHILSDADGIIDCNQAALQMLRCADKAELTAIHAVALSPERQPDGRLSAEQKEGMDSAAHQQGMHRFEWIHRRLNGEEFPAEVFLTPVVVNEKPAILTVLHDLTERKLAEQKIRDYAVILEYQKQELEQANRELCDLATSDGLTGLKNHRAFQERLSDECEVALRHQTPLSLLLLDVDHFKQFNDTFGHPAGDGVLRQVARLLEQTMRECDFVARYGGEEFVVILTQTDHAGAVRAAERCREIIETDVWNCRPVTASFGVATVSLGCSSSADLISAADQALYAAKFNGRNQVMHAQTFRSPAV